jgi:DNA polymerase III delta prime subunit
MKLNIHQTIKEKLFYFYNIRKIPNIIFNGPSGSGKSTIVNDFINLIYNENKEKIKDYVMYVNCAHGKGIKFIREELKFFAKTHIHSNGGDNFKSIVLLNGDKLTMDAQSALRRCIELFSHNTRFFIIVEDKYKLLKPILSRFCEIYVPEPEYNKKITNLYKYNIDHTFGLTAIKEQRISWLHKEIIKNKASIDESNILDFSNKIYEKGYSALDITKLIEDDIIVMNEEQKYSMLLTFNKIKKEFRNEKLLITFVLNFVFVDPECNLENMSFI